MQIKEQISIENFDGKTFKIRLVEAIDNTKAVITHYLHNISNGISTHYKEDAERFLNDFLSANYPNQDLSIVRESAIQNLLFEVENVPFTTPKNYKFKFIDLFAGIGGFRIAMQNLGGKCVFTSEWDKEAQKTYRANFGEVPFGDITKEETKKYIPSEFDVLCAGFPCQAFSIAGRRGGFEDTRGTLFFDVAEIIQKHKPKAFFLENVKGLKSHDKGKTLETILNVLRNDLEYFVPEPQIINAKDFGVPQNRERIFIVGFRKDLNINEFEYPSPTEKKVSFAEVKEKEKVATRYYLSTQYLQTLVNHKTRHEGKGNGFGYEIISDNGIANAIVVGGMGRERNLVFDDRITDFTPETKIKGVVNREGIRKMTPREWARLQGYPDTFKIVVADASAYKQFGNSVAVPAIQATAKNLIERVIHNDKKYVMLSSEMDVGRFLQDSKSRQFEQISMPNGHIYFEINNLWEARNLCKEFIDKYNLGGSNWTGGRVIDEDFNFIAHISYNGRIWDNENWKNANEIIIDEPVKPTRNNRRAKQQSRVGI